MTFNSSVAGSPIVVGQFGKSFGVLGWIKVISFTTPKEEILKFKSWLIQKNNVWEEICFNASKKLSSGIIVKLPNCNSLEEARDFTNVKIGVWYKFLPKLQDSEYYWIDLIGSNVINNQGINLGRVQDLIATGANDVLVVTGKNRYLIPYISSVVNQVDLANKTIYVDWPEDFL